MSSWSTEQLTEFLAAISSLPTADAALAAAAESAAEMFDAEVGAVVRGGVLASAVGLAGDEAAAGQLVRAARRELLEVELQGAGRCRVGVAELPNDGDDVLIVARAAGDSLAPDERSLLQGLARVLAIVLSNLELIELERRHAASLEEHDRLLEQLSRLQASISGEASIQEVLDTIVDGAAKLLRVDIGALRLVDANDPSFSVAVSTMGTLDHGDRWMRRAPLTEGVSGRAISTGSIVMLDAYRAAVDVSRIAPADMQAAIAAPLREHGEVVGSILVGSREHGRRWTDAERELLEVFAEHASLTLAASRKADQMRHAFTDSLTGLPNRALFLDRLDHQLVRAERDGTPVSVLFLDLDGFKLVNDTLGHLVGDRLLVAVAERLRECLRAADTCSRLGGDEFAVILGAEREPGHEPEAIAERIIAALRPAFDLDGREIFVSASIGIAAGGTDAETVLRNADVAMYRAKSLGKNRYVVFEQALHDALVQRLELDADLRRALDREEFELHYQPILDLGTGRVEAVEALVRWNHPERGLVPPLDFIPIAEETGLIHRLGLWVLREACREAADWQAESPDHAPVAVTVNLSGRQLQQPDLVAHVAAALAEHGLEPASLILEITETVLMHDTDGAIETLRKLKDLGVRIAIDDFGTGYSSLRYLSRFPADILKIAKPFVDALAEVGESEAALTQAIVGLGSILEVETVAEGIEERVQEDRLRELGCTFGQGYLFSRPVTAERIRELLRESAADGLAA